MEYLRVTEHPIHVGEVGDQIKHGLVQAIKSVPQHIFFDSKGVPLKSEIADLDRMIAADLNKQGWAAKPECPPFADTGFKVDLACEKHNVLIEIEKGKLPRLELDILKIASACSQYPDKWRFGALIVPSSHIQLPLAGRSSPFHYLKNLEPLIERVINRCGVNGLIVIGYEDPRSSKKK